MPTDDDFENREDEFGDEPNDESTDDFDISSTDDIPSPEDQLYNSSDSSNAFNDNFDDDISDISTEKKKYFVDDEDNEFLKQKTKAKPVPEIQIGVDTKSVLFDNIIEAGEVGQLDIFKLDAFTNISQSRDRLYTLLDSMAQDSTMQAVLETYVEDSVEPNSEGDIIWCESDDPNITKFVNFLLKSMQVDKNMYKWVMSLCKYGDLYLRLYRESDSQEFLFNKDDKDEKKPLQEDVNLRAYDKKDHYTHYVEMIPNPAELFELVNHGKTSGYIQAKVPVSSAQQLYKDYGLDYATDLLRYGFKKSDIDLFEATEFVHASLHDSVERNPEQVDIFLGDGPDDEKIQTYSYTVNRGQSLLYSSYKAWRQLMLLENSMLLNRLTKSSIVRLIGIEVGDMPKEKVAFHIQQVKNLIEQKSALDESIGMSEYNNPGPIENNVYIPTRQGVGNITTQQVGGDVDIKSLADVEYYQNKLFGSLRVPKQYFCQTDDSTGFNGGTSLSLISSRYAKAVIRIQKTMIEMLTTAINLFLIDRNMNSYINKFSLHMQSPTTQEQRDRQDNLSSELGRVSDVINLLGDVEDPLVKLKSLKSMLADVISNQDVIEYLQDYIDKLEEQGDTGMEGNGEDDMSMDFGSDFGGDFGGGSSLNDMALSDSGDLGGEEGESPLDLGSNENEGGGNLPSPSDLNMDFTDNNANFE